jgi:ABC-2 type transport system permease protein
VAVYERTYRSYAGELTGERWRFMVLPRYAIRDVFASKLFIAFLVLCFLGPLVLSVFVYLPHNSTVIKLLQTASQGQDVTLKVTATWYFWFLFGQGWLAFFMALILGPALISADLRNDALPLYLSRPFSKTEYIMGKTAILNILLSAITWMPMLAVFLLQGYLEGFKWFGANLRIGAAVFFSSAIWILMLCLLSLALSAYVKWRPVSRAAMFGLFIALSAGAGILRLLFKTEWGSIVDISTMLAMVWANLFGIDPPTGLPIWAAWLSLIAFCAACLALLARKVRPYEIVKS